MSVSTPCVCRHRRRSCDETCVADLRSGTPYMAGLRVAGRRCLVVGGRADALAQVEALVACDARVTLIAEHAHPELVQLALEASIRWSNGVTSLMTLTAACS